MADSSLDSDRDDDPGQQTMFEGGSSSPASKGRKRGPTHLKGTRSLERLRNRIDLAVKELHRLREENTALRRELDAVHKGSRDDGDGTQVVFTESPDELRRKLEDYIGLVNELIEAENSGTETEEA
jgi:hypothetical protein